MKYSKSIRKLELSKFCLGIIFMIFCAMATFAFGGKDDGGFNGSREITVISREDGSGTRGAFIELTGVEQKNSAGKKVDLTTEDAMITNSTSVMMTTIAGDKYSIGYISLGFLNDTVKALQIDGVSPSVEAIQSGLYKVVRPFNVVTGENAGIKLSDDTKDFLNFILSSDGQKIVSANGFIPITGGPAYKAIKLTGKKVVVAGSSSVTPLMEKLKEAYVLIQKNAEIEIQQSDSTTGINSVKNGICSLGMASRDLKESEISSGLSPVVIARDGISIVANNANPITGLTKAQVKEVFTGEITTWDSLSE